MAARTDSEPRLLVTGKVADEIVAALSAICALGTDRAASGWVLVETRMLRVVVVVVGSRASLEEDEEEEVTSRVSAY